MVNQKIENDSFEQKHERLLNGESKQRRKFIKTAIASVPMIITLSAGSAQAGSGAGSGIGSGPDQTDTIEETSSDNDRSSDFSDFYDKKPKKKRRQ